MPVGDKNITFYWTAKQYFYALNYCNPAGSPVWPAEVVKSPKGLLVFRAKAYDQHLILIGVDDRDNSRSKLLKARIIKRALED